MTTRLTSVRNIPSDVKEALVREAQATERSLADTAAQLLASFLGVAYSGSGRRTGPTAGVTDQLQLRLPTEVASALWHTAREWRLTQSKAAITIWAAHFHIPYDAGS